MILQTKPCKYLSLFLLLAGLSAPLFAGGQKEKAETPSAPENTVTAQQAPAASEEQQKKRSSLTVNTGAVATVNGESITEEAFDSQMKNNKMNYTLQTGKTLTPDQESVLEKQVLQAMITKYVLLQKFRDLNLSVDPDRVDVEMQKVQDQYPTEEAFKQELNAKGYTLERLRKEITQSLQVFKLQQEIIRDVQVTDDELRRAYNANLDKITQPETVHARHILIKVPENATEEQKANALTKIEAIQQELANGADFAELAKEKSEGPSNVNGGDLGFFPADKMVKPFADAAFALNPGEISGIVETSFGYHIIKVEGKKDPWLPTFEQVKESLQTQALQQKQQMIFQEYLVNAQKASDIKILRPDLKPAPAAAPEPQSAD